MRPQTSFALVLAKANDVFDSLRGRISGELYKFLIRESDDSLLLEEEDDLVAKLVGSQSRRIEGEFG